MATDGYILIRTRMGEDFSETFLDKLRSEIGVNIGCIAFCEDFDDVKEQQDFFELRDKEDGN